MAIPQPQPQHHHQPHNIISRIVSKVKQNDNYENHIRFRAYINSMKTSLSWLLKTKDVKAAAANKKHTHKSKKKRICAAHISTCHSLLGWLY